MKTIQTVIVSAFILLSINTISAQFGNNGFGGGNNRMGQMNRGMSQPSLPETRKEVPIEDIVSKVMVKLKTELTLDELQVIAISNIMTEAVKSQEALRKKESSQEDKMIETKALSEATDLKIMYLLYKEQKVKYKVLVDERNKTMDAMSDRRNR